MLYKTSVIKLVLFVQTRPKKSQSTELNKLVSVQAEESSNLGRQVRGEYYVFRSERVMCDEEAKKVA